MLKTKYLHRKSRSIKSDSYWRSKKYWRIKNIDLFSSLPFHQAVKTGYFNYSFVPLCKFIDSKIGYNWNDVYSEILTKIKKKYRYRVEDYLHSRYHWGVLNVIYDDDFIPRDYRGRIFEDQLFVENGILVKKSGQKIMADAKKYHRREKLNLILKNKDKKYNFEDDFDQKKYDDFIMKDGKVRMKKWKKLN